MKKSPSKSRCQRCGKETPDLNVNGLIRCAFCNTGK